MTTRAEIRTNAQVLYDVAGSSVLSNAEWNVLIQRGYKALWSEVCSVMPTFRTTSLSFTLTSTQTQALPADFRQVLKVLEAPGTEFEVILPNFATRIAHDSWERSYRIQGANLVIEPLQRCAGNYALIYVPTCPVLTSDASTLDAELDQFEDFVTCETVSYALSREESPQEFVTQHGRALARVQRWASDQRKSDPQRVEDVRRTSVWGRRAGWTF